MGIKNSKNLEDFSTDNMEMEYQSSINQKLNSEEKDLIISIPYKNNETKENETMNINISITEELNKSTKVDSTFDNKNYLVPFKFEWKEKDNNQNGELEVMLTGTFLNNWDSVVKMEKNPETNIYEYIALLPRAKHHFKYIINNNWKCSDLYPTEKDGSNNTNNYIDLSNFNIDINNKDNNFEKSNETKIKNEIFIKKKKVINRQLNEKFGLIFPLIKDLNATAPTIMTYYKEPFYLDSISNQEKLSNKKYLNFQKSNYSNVNISYKKILVFPHEKLGHIAPNIDDIFSKNNYNRCSITERKRHKYLTLIYYKPK